VFSAQTTVRRTLLACSTGVAFRDLRRARRARTAPGWCTVGEAAPDARVLAERLDEEEAEDHPVLEGTDAIARREGEELRFAPDAGGWNTKGTDGLGYPDGLTQSLGRAQQPNAAK